MPWLLLAAGVCAGYCVTMASNPLRRFSSELPPGAVLLLSSAGKPAGFCLPQRRLWGLQFHPEVYHTPEGKVKCGFARRPACDADRDAGCLEDGGF